jgi:hypothetical protein
MKQICPVCKVCINNGIVETSLGLPMTKEMLKSKVCFYAKREGCINDYIGKVNPFFESVQKEFEGRTFSDFDRS